VNATGMPNPGRQEDIASMTARLGFLRWPWPSPFFRDDDPDLVGLISDDAGEPANLAGVLQDSGISVARLVASQRAGTADPGVASPPVSLLWAAAKELGRNNSVLRFPRIRLMTLCRPETRSRRWPAVSPAPLVW
jgi:hypothetical protein